MMEGMEPTEAQTERRAGDAGAVESDEAVRAEKAAASASEPRTGNAARNGRFWLGVACALLGGAFWGFSGSCAQFLLGTYGIDPLFTVVFREIGASIILLSIVAVRYRAQFAAMLRAPGQAARVAVFGAALFLCQITYVVAIDHSNAGTVTVLQSANVIIIMILACLKSRTLPHLAEFLGLVAAIVATWLIATGGDVSALVLPLPALLWGLGTAVTAAIYTMYPQKLFARWGSFCVTAGGMATGAVISICATGVLAASGNPIPLPQMDATGWFVLVLIAAVGTFGAFALFLHGVSIVGSVTGSLLGCIEPVSATIVSAVWLGTVFSGADLVGLVLMIGSVFLVTLAPKKDQPKGATNDAAV